MDVDHIKLLCTEDEIYSPAELYQMELESNRPLRQVRARRSNAANASERTEEEDEEEEALASIQDSTPTYSAISPLRDECTRYITKIRYLTAEARDISSIVDPLEFFAEYKSQFPILTGVAAIVLAQDITTGDMERINSRGGIYYRPHRNRLKPETVQKIIFLYGCYVREDGGLTHRQQKARERASSFIRYQSISCQIDPSKASEEFTDFLHGLCSWIYLGDDEDNEDEDEDEEGKDQEDDEDAE
jgi:hypothetical protein